MNLGNQNSQYDEDEQNIPMLKPRSDSFGRWLVLAVLLGVILHFILFWIFEKVPIILRVIDDFQEEKNIPSEIRIVDAPTKKLEDIPDITPRLLDPVKPMEISKVVVELEDIDVDVEITPEVLDNLMDIKFDAPALKGSEVIDNFEPIIAPELDLDIPEVGRNNELLTNPLNSQIQVDPGSSVADIFDPDKFTEQLVKKGAEGVSKDGLLEGFTSLDDMTKLKGNALENAKAMIGSDLLFEFNKTELKSSARNSLMSVGYLIEENPDMICYVHGHTDLIGDQNSNLQLSKLRAEAVKIWLVDSLGIDSEKILTIPFGKSKPIVLSGDKDAQAINRRVVIKMVKAKNKITIDKSGNDTTPATPEVAIPKAQEIIPKAQEIIPKAVEEIPKAVIE